MRVGILGFGYIGSVIGAVVASKGYEVIGFEKDERILECIKNEKSPFNEVGLEELLKSSIKNGNLIITEEYKNIALCDVLIVTVGTPLKENYSADNSQIIQAINSIKDYLKDETLVILKSTVPPNTTKDIVAPMLEQINGLKLAFSPERLAEGKAIQEFLSLPIIVGGINDESTEAACTFWREVLDVEVHGLSNSTTAEMVKLADNLWIDLNIALANELAKLSDKLNIDVLEVITAANTLPKGSKGQHVNILTPSMGVGGYCLTKDPWFVQKLGEEYEIDLFLPKNGRKVNDTMPSYTVGLIKENLARLNKENEEITIAIMGISFKNNTSDCRFSPTKYVIEELIQSNYNVKICDPWTNLSDELLVTNLPVSKDIKETIRNVDCVAFLAGHKEFYDLTVEELSNLTNTGALIIDGRMFYSREFISELRKKGLNYKGIGR